ncbi:MAG: ABC transporter ATP-binding protein [Alphaproteobacteria bacterium]
MASISVEGAVKRFGSIEVLHGIDIAIEDEEFVVLVGPSGCGKSTLLRLIAGLEELSGGVIRIGDRVVNEVRERDRNIAMVFQNYALYPHMSVYGNMAFGLKLRGLPRDEIDRRIGAAAEILQIGDLLARRPTKLSGGQKQRVAMGRAMVREPEAFLFDEPLSNLDAQLRVQMRAEIRALHQRLRTTMIYVTHDQIEGMTLADRIVVLCEGRIEQVGTPAELYDRPANLFVAQFIGSPSMNLLPGRLRIENGSPAVVLEDGTAVGVSNAPAASDGRAVILGVRPEDFAIAEGSGVPGGIPVTVETVEMTGRDTEVYGRQGGQRLCIIVGRSHVLPAVGSPATLIPRPDRVQLFDVETGRRL